MPPLTKHQCEFLRRLAKLCGQYSATFGYTTDDDGIHIRVDKEDVFVGYLDHSGAAKILLEAAVSSPFVAPLTAIIPP